MAAVAISAISIGGLGVAGSAAADTPTDLPVVLDLGSLTSFVDSEGGEISIDSDTSNGSERTITGTESSGDPVVIRVYLNSPTSGEATSNDLLAEAAAGFGSTATGTAPVPAVASPDTSDFVPQVVTATTPTTISVAWKPPAASTTFDLSVDGAALPSQTVPNFTLTGLLPDTAHDVDMESSHTVTGTDPVTPVPPVSAACPDPQGVVTTDLSTWNLTESRSLGLSSIAVGGLSVVTGDTSSESKAAGYYPVTLNLADVGDPTLDWLGSSVRPGLQLVTDFDNDGTPDGILVGESAYGADWWASNGSAQFVKDGAPDHSSGFGSANHGTLAQWTSEFPTATVLAIGYSLGSGAKGNGIIQSIVVGCTEYTFRPAGFPAEPSEISDASSFVSIHTPQVMASSLSLSARSRAMRALATTLTDESDVKSTEFQYQTFLPYYTLADSTDPYDYLAVQGCMLYNGYPPDGSYTFIGDNRGFQQPDADPTNRNYRTMMDWRVDWENDTNSQDVEVGETQIVRRSTGEVVDSAHASKALMKFENPVQDADFASVTFNHMGLLSI